MDVKDGTRKNVYYVYCYLDPRHEEEFTYGDLHFNFEPFYVGKGSKNRILHHIKEWCLKRDTNKKKVNKILSIQKEGLNPIQIKLYEDLTEEESLEKERQIVSSIGRMDNHEGPLTNLTDGGEHCVHWNDLSKEKQDEIKIKRSIRMRENNLMFDKDIAKRNGEARRGQIRSKEWKDEMSDKIKNSDNHSSVVSSEEWINNQKLKHLNLIEQLDCNMKIIGNYSSIREASRQTGIERHVITKCVKTEQIYKGLIFRKVK